ncbi:MAG: hypothetical protein ACJAS6_000771 [Rickettsiales bacterium]|jgi:hypothetical protein
MPDSLFNETQLQTIGDLLDHSIETICKRPDGSSRSHVQQIISLLKTKNDINSSEEERKGAWTKICDIDSDKAIANDVDRLNLNNGIFYKESKLCGFDKSGETIEISDDQKKEIKEILIKSLDEKLKEIAPKKTSMMPRLASRKPLSSLSSIEKDGESGGCSLQ